MKIVACGLFLMLSLSLTFCICSAWLLVAVVHMKWFSQSIAAVNLLFHRYHASTNVVVPLLKKNYKFLHIIASDMNFLVLYAHNRFHS